MKIYFYPEANFRIDKTQIHEVKDITEFFDHNHLNPDDFYICGKDGQNHSYPYNSDVVAVYPRIGKGGHGKNIFTAVLGIFLTVATGGAAAAIGGLFGVGASTVHLLGVGLLCYGAGSYAMGNMKMPQISTEADSATKQSFQWNVGSLSTARGVKGITFGSNVIPEGELLSYRTYGTSRFNKNSVGSANDTHYLEMLIGCGEGPLDSIDDIKINDTPIDDIPGREYDIRLGNNIQSAFSKTNLDSQVALISVGQTIPQKLASSDTPLVVTTPTNCDSVLIACQCPSAYIFDTGSGGKNSAYLKPVIKYRTSGSTGSWTSAATGVKELDESLPVKIESTFYFNVEIKFPSNGSYEISLQNLSAELCYQKGAGGLSGNLPEILPDRVVCSLTCDNIACYNKLEQTYPGTALIYIKIPASQALNGGMPKVTWKQSRNYVWVWTGTYYTQQPANNIAWGLYDILAQIRRDNADNSFHNEGEDINNFDYSRFEQFALFCSNLGLTGNWFLNKLDSAWSTAMTLATSGRCFLGFRQGKIAPFWDAPEEMSQIFTVGSYRDMSGSILSKKDRGRAIEATFNDEDDGFKSKTIRVEVDDFSADAEAASVTYCGLSTVGAVHKAAHYMLRRNKYLCQTIKFTASIRALVCEVGDVIGVQCDITKYGVGGLIYDVINNGSKITLSEPVTLEAGTAYALLIAHENGELERKSPIETAGTYTQLTFNGAWVDTPKKSEQFTFGVINHETKKYRVTGIAKTSELECEIEAIEYVPELYNEGIAPDITYTNPNAGISSVNVTENPEGVALAWNPNPNTQYVDVYVDGSFYGRFEEGSANIPSINSTQHIELIPYNYAGQSGSSVERTIENLIPYPPTPPMPDILYVAAGYILTFKNLPFNAHLSHMIIYENGVEVAREFINGDTCVVNVALTGGIHYVEACLVNTYTKESPQRSIVLSPPQIAGWTIEYDQISSTNMQIKAEGSIQTADFVSGHNGWCLDKYGKAEFQDATIRGTMTSVNFVKDTVSAVGGSLMILGSAEVQEFVKTTQNTQNILCEDFIDLTTEDGSTLAMEQSGTSVYYEITLDDASTFSNGDILRIRNAGTVQDLWLGQASKSANTLSCVMLYGVAMELESGMCAVNYRKAGNGGILLNGNVPLMDMFTHSGRPWEGTDCWVRMGNIKGINSITDDRFGIFVGDSNGSHSGRHYMQYDEKSGKLQIQGEVLITSGVTYNNISNAISAANTAQTTANTAQTTANTAQTTANTANTNANAALAFRNAVANTNYTSIKGGAITTGLIKSGNYRYTSGDYADAGSALDLDNGIFRSVGIKLGDSDGVKIKAGLLNGINIATIITAVEASCSTKTVTSTYSGTSVSFTGVKGFCRLNNGITVEWDILPVVFGGTWGQQAQDISVVLPKTLSNSSYMVLSEVSSSSFAFSVENKANDGFEIKFGSWSTVPAYVQYLVIALA